MIHILEHVIKFKDSDSIAIYCNANSYSYRQLFLDVFAMSDYLAKNYSFDKNKPVAVYLDKSYSYIVTILSLWLNGLYFVPINKFEVSNRIKVILKDCRPEFIISEDAALLVFLNSNIITIPFNKINFNVVLKTNIASLNISDPAYLIYTSGSTGHPKGVLISHYGIDNAISSQIKFCKLNIKVKFMWLLNLAFDASMSDILTVLCSGGTLYIPDFNILEIKKMVLFINLHKINTTDIPPSILSLLDPANLKSLKKIIIGGETPNIKTIQKFLKYKINVYNSYGPTETTISSSMYKFNIRSEIAYIGNPLMGVEYLIINDELLIGGENLAIGYFNNKSLTENKFINIENKRFYKTGDKVIRTKNNYRYIDRLDRQFKVNGVLISPEEIETHIKNIEGIDNVAVCFVNKKIILYIENNNLFNKIDTLKNNIILAFNKNLPKRFHPNYIIFVEKLIYNINKKIDFKALSSIDYKKLNLKNVNKLC